jgi:hypothetical protein
MGMTPHSELLYDWTDGSAARDQPSQIPAQERIELSSQFVFYLLMFLR